MINLILLLQKHNKQIILSGIPPEEEGFSQFASYLHDLSKRRSLRSYVDDFLTGFDDYLQLPLQPLYDNLSSQTYETFEKDPGLPFINLLINY